MHIWDNREVSGKYNFINMFAQDNNEGYQFHIINQIKYFCKDESQIMISEGTEQSENRQQNLNKTTQGW